MKCSALLIALILNFRAPQADGNETYLKPFAVVMNVILSILLVMVNSYINLV